MDEQLQRYEGYARDVKRLSIIAGLWPGGGSSRYFRLMVVAHFTASIITSFGIMYFVVSHRTNIGLLTKGLGIAISFGTMLLKLIVLSVYRDRLTELHEILDQNFRSDLVNPHYRAVLLSPIEYFYRPTLWLSLSTVFVISVYNLHPLISIIIQLSHGAEVLQRRTPYPSKYPFPEGNTLFVVSYVIEVAASYTLISITTTTDALFGFYIFQMAGQLRLLSYRMCNLIASDDHLGVIRECVARRQRLARCRDHLQTIYGPVILWMLTGSAMNMCTNIYQASQWAMTLSASSVSSFFESSHNPSGISLAGRWVWNIFYKQLGRDSDLLEEALHTITIKHHLQISMDKAVVVYVYIAMKLMQTLLYGWFGSFLKTESEVLQDAMYSSGWAGSGDKLFLSNVLTMLMCKPLALKACHFYPISLEMFMAIVNTALSYFFLLRTLDEK